LVFHGQDTGHAIRFQSRGDRQAITVQKNISREQWHERTKQPAPFAPLLAVKGQKEGQALAKQPPGQGFFRARPGVQNPPARVSGGILRGLLQQVLGK
jgi:hypothetical protein